jgi:hypothetical protein
MERAFKRRYNGELYRLLANRYDAGGGEGVRVSSYTNGFPSASLFDALLGPIAVAHGRLNAAS